MAAITTGFQIASITVYCCILLASLYAWHRWRVLRFPVAIPSIWAGYGVIYYSMLLAGRFTPDALFLWGAIHRLLAGVIFLIGVLALIVVMAAPGPIDWTDDHDLE